MENLVFYLAITLIVVTTVYLMFGRKLTTSKSVIISVIISGIISVISVISGISGIIGEIIGEISGMIGISGIIGEIIGEISEIALIGVIGVIGVIALIGGKSNSRQNKKIKKNYPKLSIIGIMRERKGNQKFQTIYLLLIITIIYIFASKFLNFTTSNIFLYVLLGSVLLIALESLIFNYRVNQGWYGSSELEAREIINFIVKNSEDIDFTDGNSLKSIIKPEDIQQVIEELGIQIPGYPEPNAINKSFSEG